MHFFMKNKIYIIGATGYLGKYLFTKFIDLFDVTGTTSNVNQIKHLTYFDLSNPSNFDYSKVNTEDYVVFCSAISSPDICKNDFEFAHSINVVGTEVAVANFLQKGARVIFCSSDTVYGHQKNPVDENILLNPVGEYGKMKMEIEKKFAKNKNFKIIRLSYIFSAQDKFTQFVVKSIVSEDVIEIFDPLYRNIVWRDDVAAGIKNLILKWDRLSYSVFNFGGPASLSRDKFVKSIFKGYNSSTIVKTSCPPDGFFNNRPREICLDISRFNALLTRPPRSIEEAAVVEFQKY